LTRLFEDGLGPVALVAIALSAAITAGLRRLPFGPVGSWAVSTLALIWFIGARFLTDTLWGPIPGWDTFVALGDAIREGADQTIREVAPVEATVPLLIFTTAGIWVSVWLIDTALVRLHNPVLAVASAVPLFVVPGAILQSKRLALEIVLFLAAAGLALVHDQGERFARLGPTGSDERAARWRLGSALRILVVALAVVAVMTPSLPGFGRTPALQGLGGAGSRVFFNPIVAIKPALDDDRNIELFRVASSKPSYYRLTALDVFDGEAWRQESRRETRRFTDGLLGTSELTEPVRQEFVMGALAGPWLPAVYRPVQVTGDDALVETATDTLLVGDRLEYGLTYEVESRAPSPSVELLDQAIDYDERAIARLLALPDSMPARVREIAREITRDTANPYQAALAIQRHLRRFTYDEDVASGHSFNDIVEFLTEVKAGYCEQFAGSMAVLSRSLGIPSRVAIGFGVGELVDRGVYRVTTRHAHAWVEVWFPQAGWVPFEPTPRAGVTRLPDYTPPARVDPPEPTTEPTSSPRQTTQPEPTRSALPTSPDEQGAEPGGPIRGWVTGLVVLGMALMTVAAGPAVARRARGRRGALRRFPGVVPCGRARAGRGRDPSRARRPHRDRACDRTARDPDRRGRARPLRAPQRPGAGRRGGRRRRGPQAPETAPEQVEPAARDHAVGQPLALPARLTERTNRAVRASFPDEDRDRAQPGTRVP
jgi:transglutaminase-like putative cysteine protease